MHADAEHPNCAYKWMEHSIDPKVQGDLGAWFGSVPVMLDACKGNALLTDAGCDTNGLGNFDKIALLEDADGEVRDAGRRLRALLPLGLATTSPSSADVERRDVEARRGRPSPIGRGCPRSGRVRGCGGSRDSPHSRLASPHPAASQPPSPSGRRLAPARSDSHGRRRLLPERLAPFRRGARRRRRHRSRSRAGEFFAMLGPSGSGKTTCLRLIAGFDQPTSGHIEIFGETAEGVPPYRRNVNTVFQDYALFPHMNVLDNVAYGLMVKGVAKAERHATGARGAGARQARRHGGAAAGAAFRRAAAARGARARAGQPPEGAASRRAARRARPEAPRADAGGAEGAAAAARHHLRLRHPRPGRGAVDGRPRGDLQRGPARAGRHAARRLRAARRRASSPISSAPPTCSTRISPRVIAARAPGPAFGRKASRSARAAFACRTAAGSTGSARKATVTSVQYQGADDARQRRCRRHARSASPCPRASLPGKPGERVTLSWRPRALHTLEAE